MDSSEKILRKKRRLVLTRIRESCIFTLPVSLSIEGNTFQSIVSKVTENDQRNLNLIREITLIVKNDSKKIEELSNCYILLDIDGEIFSIKLTAVELINDHKIVAKFSLLDSEPSNRRSKIRRKEPVSHFSPIMLYTEIRSRLPIFGYGRIVDSDEKTLCYSLQFFQKVEELELNNSELMFQEKPLGIFSRTQKIVNYRNYFRQQQAGTQITKVDVILVASGEDKIPRKQLSVIQPSIPLNIIFEGILHDKKIINSNLLKLYIDGFCIELSEYDTNSLPSLFQIDHKPTGLRFNVHKLNGELFVSYIGLSLGKKVIWFNFITQNILRYDHCFTSNDSKKIIHLMFESGNYNSHAILQLSLLNDFFQNKWPIEESYSPTKYRWLVRDKNGNYIGHTSGVRVSESLWAAIDNIGSQSYSGSWNSEFVARWIRSLAELLSNSEQEYWIQWTFVPDAGVWTKFDEMLQQRNGLVCSRDRFWGVFLLNRIREDFSCRNNYKVKDLGENYSSLQAYIQNLSDSQKRLLNLISDGINGNSTFQMDFEQEYGFRLKRYYYLIEDNNNNSFLLTFTNYPSWATLHKGHNWDYLFPLSEVCQISSQSENELLDTIEETIFRSGCTPYRLAIVSPVLKLTTGIEWINLSLHPNALELAAKSLEKL